MTLSPAALGGAVLGEGSNDDQASRPDRMQDLTDIGAAVLGCGQEMEHCAIMPDIVALCRQIGHKYVRLQPAYICSARPQSCAVHGQCVARNVGHRDVAVTRIQQIVDQGGCATTNVDDPRRRRDTRFADELERAFGMRLKPADLGGGPGRVDLFPMCLGLQRYPLICRRFCIFTPFSSVLLAPL